MKSKYFGVSRKPIPIGVKIEAEGGGKGQGTWIQAANDLSPSELKTLESLVVAEIQKQEAVKIVPLDYKDDYIGIVAVVAKISNGNPAKADYIASSVVSVVTKGGKHELVTHDVLAGADLTALTHSIAFQFAGARLQAAKDLWK